LEINIFWSFIWSYISYNKIEMEVVLFFSWLKTWVWFYIFKGFRMWNYEQIEFLEKSFNPQNKRDERLMNKILDFNRNRLKNPYQLIGVLLNQLSQTLVAQRLTVVGN